MCGLVIKYESYLKNKNLIYGLGFCFLFFLPWFSTPSHSLGFFFFVTVISHAGDELAHSQSAQSVRRRREMKPNINSGWWDVVAGPSRNRCASRAPTTPKRKFYHVREARAQVRMKQQQRRRGGWRGSLMQITAVHWRPSMAPYTTVCRAAGLSAHAGRGSSSERGLSRQFYSSRLML